jgi:hypothetical protein
MTTRGPSLQHHIAQDLYPTLATRPGISWHCIYIRRLRPNHWPSLNRCYSMVQYRLYRFGSTPSIEPPPRELVVFPDFDGVHVTYGMPSNVTVRPQTSSHQSLKLQEDEVTSIFYCRLRILFVQTSSLATLLSSNSR